MKKLRVEGKGPKYYKVGRRVVYHMRDLDTWLSRQPRETADTLDAPTPPRRRRRKTA
jgi:hypothetical protein